MNAATDFDLGPLTWVKGEIDLALERATEALHRYREAGDATQLKFCRTHLHQVHGALSIVGLDGVTQLSESLEALLGHLETADTPAPTATLTVVDEAFAALRQYLDDLLAGEPNQPLRLLSTYQAIAQARGLPRANPTDLFFPDLGQRPPRRPAGPPLTQEEKTKLIRSERSRFQKGLLAWLRHQGDSPASHDGLTLMQEALRRIEATQLSPSTRTFWWAALGLVTALDHGATKAGDARSLCARIDLQIRRLLEGNPGVAERLLRDALYFVAHSPAQADPLLQEIQGTYQLAGLIPAQERTKASGTAPHEAILRRLRETIVTAEEQWNRFCAGSTSALTAFVDQTRSAAQLASDLDHTDLKRLAHALTAAANWLAQQPARQSDGVAMEIATALLLIQTALESYTRLGQDFARQVDLMVARLEACMAGTQPVDDDLPLLDEMSRRAQERLLMAQVAREIQSNLAQIEQVLDGYFRDNDKRPDAPSLSMPLKQIAGALTILGQDHAAEYLRNCETRILDFADPAHPSEPGEFEAVAQQLSTLGFFIDSLQHGNADFDTFLKKLQGEEAAEAAPDEHQEEIEPEEITPPVDSVESQLARLKTETRSLLEAFKATPEDPSLREALQQHLQALQKDADLVADQALLSQAKAALAALADSSKKSAPQMADVEEALAPIHAQPEAPVPSAETLQLAQASTDELDAELLSIFLEEAQEVLAAISQNIAILHAHPHDTDTLTIIRRSAHTLKGSGRMVGLKDLGETAWAVEQTLNLWLRQEQEIAPELLDMIELAHQVFSIWVEHLASGDGLAPDPTPLIRKAEALRGLEVEIPAAAPPAPPPQVLDTPVAPEPSAPIASQEIPVCQAEEEPLELTLEAPQLTQDEEEIDLKPLELEANFSFEPFDIPEEPSLVELPFEPTTPEPLIEEALELDLQPFELETQTTPPEPQPEAEAHAPAQTLAQTLTISPALYEIFRDEARGHLDTLNHFVAELDMAPAMPTPFEIGRAAHTLAGIAGTVGINPINKLGHALEHALLRRDATHNPDSLEGREVLRHTMDMLETMLNQLAEGRTPENQPSLVEALNQLYPPAPEHAQPSPVEAELQLLETSEATATPSEVALAEKVTAPGEHQETPPLLQDELDDQLLPIFLEEAQELVDGFQTQIAAWRADRGNEEAAHALARLLHTFKGGARMAGAMNLGEATHAVESRVGELLKMGPINDPDLDEIEAACDILAQGVERIQSGGKSLPMAALQEVGTSQEAKPTTLETIESSRPTQTGSPTAAPLAVPQTTEGLDHEGQRPLLRVRADLVDQLVNEAGELSIARARIEGEMRELKDSLLDLTENVIRLRRQLREIEIQAETQIQANTGTDAKADFDPLELDRFTRFQELTRMMAESVNDVATVQQTLLKNLDDANAAITAQARLNRSLQQSLMSVRMVPFASQSERLYRLVRQTAKETGKRANLELLGGKVELDRSVLDKVLPPLEHMLRNAVAHGLEARETRLAAGKPEIGEISLSLAQEGNEIILTLSDDGAGLNLGRIRQKAEVAGLIAPGEIVEDKRLVDFIFHSGFSTATEVSQVAGRGVGMDVVKTEVTGLGGRIEVITQPGHGTTFRLYLPLTLAVTQTLLVKVAERLYAIPSAMVEQVMEIKEKALNDIRDRGEALWQDHRYPLHYLPRLLGDLHTQPTERRLHWILLLRSGAQRVAIQVDDLRGNQEIVVKNVGPQMARVVGIAGATVLGDGQVVLILNPVALASRLPEISASIEGAPATAQPVPEAPVISRVPTIMVVDDSLTVRKITSKLLTREGYHVVLAKDGVDALEQLIERIPDVILSDIEMPRMDGFDLVRNIRADGRLVQVPIIMITSRTADKHRNYAMEIGANQYLGKPYDEDELLRLLANYTRAGQ